MRKNLYLPDEIQGVHEQIERIADQPNIEAQVGLTMIVVSRLLRLTAHLYSRIVDLEKVQNERGEE